MVYERRSEIDDIVAEMFSTTDKQYLNTSAVRREFERLLKLVLRGAEFWENETFLKCLLNMRLNCIVFLQIVFVFLYILLSTLR